MTSFALLDALWSSYLAVTPQARQIHALLAARGEVITNEHIALRTLAVPGLGLDALGGAFEELGFAPRERARREAPHVRGRVWQQAAADHPRLVVGELAVGELSPRAQAILAGLVAQLPRGFSVRRDLGPASRPWSVTRAEHAALGEESAHAAWVAAFGLCPHHVALDASALATFPDLVALEAFLVEHGFPLDAQRATKLDHVEVTFADGTAWIPSGTFGFSLGGRRGRERREVVVELEQHVDIHADELHAHAGGGRPPHHGG